jgi:hypothetical protein
MDGFRIGYQFFCREGIFVEAPWPFQPTAPGDRNGGKEAVLLCVRRLAMKKALILVYGIFSYVGFLGVFTYFAAFVGDFVVPKTVNSGPTAGLL